MEKSWIIYQKVDIKLSPPRNNTNGGVSTCVSKSGDAHRQSLLNEKTLVQKDQLILSLLQQESPLASLGGKCLVIM